jgi:phenylalanyl-tRNA synthetase beta chain
MKFTLSWLKDHLDTTAGLDEIVATLTRIGLEVERVIDRSASLAGFVVAEISEARRHPNADRLQVCTVKTGDASLDVVCGAPNARAGLKSVFAPVGTYIPGKQMKLGPGVIRGVASNGMLCSAAELALSDESEGIMELPPTAPVGRPYALWAGLDDPVIEINLTPNRPDAMGVAGIARDLAAAGLGRVVTPPVATDKAPDHKALDHGEPCPVDVRIELSGADAALAPAFALRQVSGLRNAASPAWMQARLRAIGLRPISALVDITNYLAFDRARPLHVFDAKKVKGALTIRRALQGETIKALDGKTYTLDDSMVVIADSSGAISIAGVMGGESTGCDESTTDVLIESALWSPSNIAATGRRLGIVSDARYRFERGIDPSFCLPGLDLATRLVLDFCGGTPSQRVLAGTIPAPNTRIVFPVTEVPRLTGLDVPLNEVRTILDSLGFELARNEGNADKLVVKVPSWRPDVTGKADLVEEIIRIAGIDRIVAAPLPPRGDALGTAILTPLQRRSRLAKRALAASGLIEAVTWSFVSEKEAALFAEGRPALPLANPIAADLSHMRPSVLPGLIAALRRNAARGAADLGLFEVGQIFLGDGEDDQKIAAAGVRMGSASLAGSGRHWSGGGGAVSFYDAKADALALLSTLGVSSGGLQTIAGGSAAFHPGRSATLRFGPKTLIGRLGEIHPRILEDLDIEGPLVAFEIILDDIPAPKSKPTKAKARLDLSELMPLQRDFAFIVDDTIEAGEIVKAALGADRSMIADVAVFDIYAGPGVPVGKKSVAIAATIQPKDQTLTEPQIDAITQKIVSDVTAKTGASLRG